MGTSQTQHPIAPPTQQNDAREPIKCKNIGCSERSVRITRHCGVHQRSFSNNHHETLQANRKRGKNEAYRVESPTKATTSKEREHSSPCRSIGEKKPKKKPREKGGGWFDLCLEKKSASRIKFVCVARRILYATQVVVLVLM